MRSTIKGNNLPLRSKPLTFTKYTIDNRSKTIFWKRCYIRNVSIFLKATGTSKSISLNMKITWPSCIHSMVHVLIQLPITPDICTWKEVCSCHWSRYKDFVIYFGMLEMNLVTLLDHFGLLILHFPGYRDNHSVFNVFKADNFIGKFDFLLKKRPLWKLASQVLKN